MHLKKLELSGFKSFARPTTLEFPSKITAIVGPNGSGKSNIAESVRWVLGEQSMKSLRGKKGEDLIWNGSPASFRSGSQAPRIGKASVNLIFDNRDGKIPLEFDEVSISRKIFRDGMNEYWLNDSQVRLKDVVELMARIGLGETKHNIIAQGEVDRLLLSSARDKRAMLEEALGLRVYQLKKNEAERKLDSTENNMKQVEGLIRELAPHLRFLREQSKKAESRAEFELELKSFQKIYFAKEKKEIEEQKKRLEAEQNPLFIIQNQIKKEIDNLSREVDEMEKQFIRDGAQKGSEDKILRELEVKRREFERELGRLEGKLELEKERAAEPRIRIIDTRYVQEEIREFISEIKTILEEEDQVEIMRSHFYILVEDLEKLLDKIERGKIEEKRGEEEFGMIHELEKTIKGLHQELAKAIKEVQKYEISRSKERETYRVLQQKIHEFDSLLRAKQDEERDIILRLERFRFEEERIRARREALSRGIKEAGIGEEEISTLLLDGYENTPQEELRKKIERMCLKLEEIGGIDNSVVKEFQETESRSAFLVKELEDLKQASISLKKLVRELDEQIKNNFKEGFGKIKNEFHNYFRIIFGGGGAILRITKQESRIKGETEEDAEYTEEEEGIEIEVDLPRKRIKGLAMLSGGERALTSIALLFAITAVNPPPFLVLDETDAALDEANSQRYAAILKELSKKTQLILVTHNRETMKCAGILYGVTMGDDGVSKLLSLKLEEAESYTNH